MGQREDVQQVGALLDAWDPIGVYADAADGRPPGEYDRLVMPVLSKLRAGESEADLAAFLASDAQTNMGLTGPLNERDAARRLCEWWQRQHKE